MDQMLGDLLLRCAVVLIDDITIFSLSLGQHLVDLGKVFKQLATVNLKINLNRCNFVKYEVKLLGHLLLKQGICPVPKKVEIIQKLTPPTGVTSIKSFLGVVNYIQKLFYVVLF